MLALLLAVSLAGSPCDDFAADVARRAELMAQDVETMPLVVREGLRQLAFDAKARSRRGASIDKLRKELREVIRRGRQPRAEGEETKP